MKIFKQLGLAVVFALLFGCALVGAQTTSRTPAPTDSSTTAAAGETSHSPANLIEAANKYKTSSTELLAIQKDAVAKAEAKLDELRALVSEGLVAKLELEDAEQKVSVLHAQLQVTYQQISDSDKIIGEIRAGQELAAQAAKQAKLLPKQPRTLTTPTMLRYNGSSVWSIGGFHQIQSFFTAKFGRGLPTSAVGQSATHNRLGYDHRNAIDVALHPDSIEGKTLINYLQLQGIPFLAFRAAIPGVATGPHIHIGSPSHRLS